MKNKFTFIAELWLYPGMAGNWHFVSLSEKDVAELKKAFGPLSHGWGSLPVEAQIGKTKWNTSIFPNKKSRTYILPIKASVRKSEGFLAGDRAKVKLSIIP